MKKRKDYSRASFKSKKPISIRYNIADFEAAAAASGRSTVQSLFDYLISRYLVELDLRKISPIEKIDTRPIDKNISDVSRDVGFYIPRNENVPPPKISFTPIDKNSFDGSAVSRTSLDDMPMWTPQKKEVLTPKKTEPENSHFVENELKRLEELRKRTELLKGKKKS
jgi:hypothetical protein